MIKQLIKFFLIYGLCSYNCFYAKSNIISTALGSNNKITLAQASPAIVNEPVPAQPAQQAQPKKTQTISESLRKESDRNKIIPLNAPTKNVVLQQSPSVEKKPETEAAPQKETSLSGEEKPDTERIEFQFEDADLTMLVKEIEHIFDVTFVSDDMVQPLRPGAKTLKGNKLSFKTNDPLSREQAWSLFLTFLEIAGFTIVPYDDPKIYRIEPLDAARKAPIPAFIGINFETLPETDQIIRYVYFIQNSTTDTIKGVVEALKSKEAPLLILNENKAFILTDKAYNIKTLMKIVKELDRVTMPQALSIVKLRQADAQQVKALLDTVLQAPQEAGAMRPLTARKQPTALFFPEGVRIVAEPRTNSLVLLGPQDALKKIEDFIVKSVDVDLDQPYSPLFTYQLKYADASVIADVLTNVTKLGQQTPVGLAGGVRGIDKYFKSMTFTAERETNRIIIKGDFEDYSKVVEIIKQLDEQQPQVAIDVLILAVDVNQAKELGVQLRSKEPGINNLVGPNVKFQTSGLRAGGAPQGIVENPEGPGVYRLLGNLLNLVTGANGGSGPGNTIISLGQDIFGVWGVLQILQTLTNLQVISNPFLIATNKTPAKVEIGETRRVVSGLIIGGAGTVDQQTFESDKAVLSVTVQPQINNDGFIRLDLVVEISNFVDLTDPTSATKNTRKVDTQTIVADGEILALGGLVRNTIRDNLSKVPVLADIPILGWLFKNKRKEERKESLLILVSTKIIQPESTIQVSQFTKDKIQDYEGTLDMMHDVGERKDPIHRMFFQAAQNSVEKKVEHLIFDRATENNNRRRRRRGKRDKTRPLAEPSIPIPAHEAPQEITIDHTRYPIAKALTLQPPSSQGGQG